MENQRPFSQSFLHFPAQNPDVLAKNRAQIGLQLDIANQLLIPRENGAVVEEDFETQRLKIEYRRGLGRGFEAAVSGQILARNGGVLDQFLTTYHDLIGYGADSDDNPQGRDSRPKNRAVFRFEDPNGRGVDVGRALGFGDTTLSLKKQIARGKTASAARLALKIPTGSDSEILGSGGFDAGISFDARRELSRKWAFFGNASLLQFGSSAIPNARKNGWQGGLGLEWKVGRRDSVVAQFDAHSATVKTGNRFADDTPVVASLGWKRRVSEGRSVWASFSENGDWVNYNAAPLGNIGPDFTLSFGYEWRR